MIAFGVCIGDEERYRRCAVPGLRRVAEPSSPVGENRDNKAICPAYNEVLDAFADLPDLEALVLLHEDLEIRDLAFMAKVRAVLSSDDIAVAGVVGATGVRSLAWWEGSGRGRCAETRGMVDFGAGRHDVDVVDGLMLVLSPWAVRNLRFDAATYDAFHGYDVDFCLQARAAGKRVVTFDVDVFHHTRGGYGDGAAYQRANAAFVAKWADSFERLPPLPPQATCPVCALPCTEQRSCPPSVIAVCPNCGSGVTVPAPTRNVEGAGLFEERYGGARLAMRPQWQAEAHLRLAWLRRYAPNGTLLEVGCATGEFAAAATLAKYHTFAVEANDWAAEQARALGVDCTTGFLADWSRAHPDTLVDVVAGFHVLEHVHEPHEFLAELHQLLSPGGVLALEVPNFAAADAIEPASWSLTSPDDHVFHYTPDGLQALLADTGYAVMDTLTFTYRSYDAPAVWQQRLARWDVLGRSESQDLLRVVARTAKTASTAVRRSGSPERVRFIRAS